MQIKNIVFDFGGVLIDWNPIRLYQKIFKDEKEMDYFLSKVCTPEWNLRQDEGRLIEDAVNERIAKFPEYKSEIECYYSRWIEMIGGEIEENTSLVKGLKENYTLYGLSNWSAETFPLVYEEYSFFKEMEGIVLSGAEKVIKPDRKIFDILLERYDIVAEQSLFIDDNEINIKAAREIGFTTIHLKEGVCLRDELVKMGLQII